MLIFIPTSQRAEMLFENIKDLKDADKIVLFVNNCDIKPYRNLKWHRKVQIVDYTDIQGCPKKCHNETFRRMISINHDLAFLIMEDDVVPCDGFIRKMKSIITALNIYDIDFTFSPIWIPEKKCNYTKAEEFRVTHFNGCELKTQKYVDGNFYVTKTAHKVMKEALKKEVPVLKSNSGISPVLSKAFFEKGILMINSRPSMLGHGNHESLQFKEGRTKVPLIAKL